MLKVLLLVLIAALSYCVGSLNGAILSSRLIWKKDVRDYGSGNAGLTNFYRVFGAPGAALLIITDVLKTVIPVLLGGLLYGLVGEAIIGKLFAGFCVILGHAFPVWYEFKGGKGVLCGGTAALLVDWRVGLIVILAFALVVIFTRYVSLGSLCAAVLFPIVLAIFKNPAIVNVLGLFCGLLIILKHSGNIGRLIAGKESKLEFRKTEEI